MFFFFAGGLERQVRQVLKSGVGRCINCGSRADLVEYEKVLKLFFVPVWRWPGKEPVLYCDNCRFMFPQSCSLPPRLQESASLSPAAAVSDALRCRFCDRSVEAHFRYLILVFGGFVQFQTRYVTDEASMQEMFSIYIENRAQISFIELYVEFEQSEADRNILREDYNSDSEEEFESNYECVGPDGDEDQGDGNALANALANDMPFGSHHSCEFWSWKPCMFRSFQNTCRFQQE
ncbi:hypothetical protein Ahy_B10g101782 [Arachis hypogaea]|uniref:Zinc-ribbon 15 domain-containing protein n=1 Tax=Arachis hypogaea TaxID=3818 RepID=A0A444X0C4_ARAHY|nr:hypothetical protein Ahy_B10g101782 [Arachis hypogaea]